MVAADTTETSLTAANPDGTLTTTISALPARVRSGGGWKPVSALLDRGGSGTWHPAATPSGLEFSGGGRGPLATLTSPSGGVLTVSLPVRLPAPRIHGATALYRSVLPGTDLRVTASTAGGFSEQLIFRSRAASIRRAIRELSPRFAGRGLGIRPAGHGGLYAASPGGAAGFSVSPPELRGTPAGDTPPALRGLTGQALPVTADFTGDTLAMSPAAAPPSAAAASPVTLNTTVAPDLTTSCTSSGTVTCSKDSPHSSTIGFVEVSQGSCPDYPGWNSNPGGTGLAIGLEDYEDDSCGNNIAYRSFYGFDVSSLNASMKIQSATLILNEEAGADHTCGDTWPVHLYWVSGAGSSTTWSNQPKVLNSGNSIGTNSIKPADCGSTGSVYTSFNVRDQVVDSKSASVLDLGIRGDEAVGDDSPPRSCTPGDTGNGLSDGGDNCGFMRFYADPTIKTTWDEVPAVPAPVDTEPPAHTIASPDAGCKSSAPYPWLGKTDGTAVHLRVSLYAPVNDEPVRAKYSVTDTTDPSANVTAGFDYANDPGSTGNYSNWYNKTSPGSPQTTTTPVNFPGGAPADGHQYKWSAQAEVNGDPENHDLYGPYDSASSRSCYFNVDETAPTVPAVTSTAFPPGGGTTVNGNPGTFSFSSTDPVPAGCSPGPCLASGVYGYAYSLNTPIPAAGISGNSATQGISTTGSVSLTIGSWGTNILYAEAIDNAGNYSQPVAYSFYVPWNGQPPVPGDINGDGKPDLLATTSSGGLSLYPGDITTSLPAATDASGPGESPDSATDWNTFQITHRGTSSQQGSYDDLYALKGGNLYRYLNNPADHGVNPYDNTADVTPVAKPACSASVRAGNCSGYHATDWSDSGQILSPGDAWAGSGSDDGCGSPSLLTAGSDGQLWLYQGQCGGGTFANPVLLGSAGWNGATLIAPGTIAGDLTIWARDNSTGAIYSFPVTIGSDGMPTLNPNPATPATPVTATSGTIIPGISLPNSTYPVIASTGDNETGSTAALYTIDISGNVWEYAGTEGDTTPGTGNDATPLSASPVKIGTIPAGSITQLS